MLAYSFRRTLSARSPYALPPLLWTLYVSLKRAERGTHSHLRHWTRYSPRCLSSPHQPPHWLVYW